MLNKARFIEENLKDEVDEDFVHHLQVLKDRAKADLEQLEAMLKDHIIENYPQLEASNGSNVRLEFSKTSWLKRERKANRLFQSLRDTRKSIDEAISQLHVLVTSLASRTFPN